MNSSLNDVCYKQISENFYYGIFGDFHLVIDKATGYFNATKLCALAQKDFFEWKRLARTKHLISYLQDQSSDSDRELVYEIKGDNKHNKNKQITGQYVHKDLILDIASWISPEFYCQCNNVVIDYFANKYKSLGEDEKKESFKNYKLEMKNIIQEKDMIIEKQSDKIDELMKKLDAAEEARKADARRAEDMLQSLGINLLDVKKQNAELIDQNVELLDQTTELLDEVQDTNDKLTTVQKKLNIAVEDRASFPAQKGKKERFVLLKRIDEEDFPYYVIRGQHSYVRTTMKNQKEYYEKVDVLLDFPCHPNSKTLFMRLRTNLRRKGVEFNNCKISIRDSTVSEGDLTKTMKLINDEKMNV
jgi:hypothetical protein